MNMVPVSICFLVNVNLVIIGSERQLSSVLVKGVTGDGCSMKQRQDFSHLKKKDAGQSTFLKKGQVRSAT